MVCKFWSESKGPRNVEANSARSRPSLKVQEQEHQCPKGIENAPAQAESKFPLSLSFHSIRQIGYHPPTLVKVILFTQSTYSNKPLSHTHTHTHNTITHIPSNYVLPNIWASLSPVELTHKIITGVHEPLNSTQAWVERGERSLGGQARP